jgi:cytochrome c-type biogenesis protein
MENVTLLTIGISFLAGILSFLSPCVLPLVPGYISLISGVSVDGLKEGVNSRKAVIFNSLAFNAGLSVIFVSLGTTAGLVGSAVLSNPWVRIIGGLVIIAFGLQLIGLLKISALYRDTRSFSDTKPRGMLGSLTLGIAFAAGWTPCIGPILGGIIGLAATSGGWRSGLILSSFYSAGLAVPFLFTGIGINKFLSFYRNFRKHLHKVEVVSGVILIAIGLLVMTNRVTVLSSSWLASVLPNLESKLTPVDKSAGNKTPTSIANAKPAPDVQFAKLDGGNLKLSDLRGRVVVLNFWATWCMPCRSEIPVLSAMEKALGSEGLTVVGVSYDDTAELIQDFQKDLKQDYLVVLGGKDVGSSLPAASLPTTYIIDREGRIRETFIGERTQATFEAAVKPLLTEVAATARN